MRPEGGVAESALGTVRMGLDKDLDVLCGLDNRIDGFKPAGPFWVPPTFLTGV